jgi:hypothetical protein
MKQMTNPLLTTLFVLGMCFISRTSRAETPSPGASTSVLLTNGSQQITLGEPVQHENLTIFPLMSSKIHSGNPYTPLDTAMDRGALRVTELASATVPTLNVKNSGKEKVFIMTGEIVTGAKQDRMSAHDVLLPPSLRSVKLQVYCVEQGRWVQNSRQFAAGKTTGTTMLRKTAAKKGGQGTIWSKVAKKSGDASVNSATGTMQAVYNNRQMKRRITAFENRLGSIGRRNGIVGFVAAIDGNIVSADLFANHTLLKSLYGKLLKAVAIDAVTSQKPSRSAPQESAVRQFVKTGYQGNRSKTSNPGLGAEFLIDAENDISGTILIYQNEMVHLSIFGPDREDKPRALGRSRGSAHRSTRPVPQQLVSPVNSIQNLNSNSYPINPNRIPSNKQKKRAAKKRNPISGKK